MNIELRTNGEVCIQGYVNAVERDSRKLNRRMCPGAERDFVERVRAGTFQKALSRGHPIEARFNHDRVIATTADGSLELCEDNIGLFATLVTTDAEVNACAQRGELRGWSFGFVSLSDEWEDAGEATQRRTLNDIDLKEVSVLTKTPAYVGTSIEMRDDKAEIYERRGAADDTVEVKRQPNETARFCEIEILKLKGKRK